MGTRGAYGYRIDGQDKVTYNHFDSYPDVLGANTLAYTMLAGYDSMRRVANRITLVNGDERPEKELVERYKSYADLEVSSGSLNDWYCLLRKTQGTLCPYHDDLEHMIDSHGFLADSLFCEWAYIINLDAKQFEVYRGFNTDTEAAGRYASLNCDRANGYFGVKLIATAPLEGLCEELISPLTQFLNAYERAEVL